MESPTDAAAPHPTGRLRSENAETPLRLGVWGRGRLGSAIVELAEESGHADRAPSVAWNPGREPGEAPSPDVDVLIDASVGEAVPGHLDFALEHGLPLVIAATGWTIDDLEARVGDRIGVVVAPNGSLGVALVEGWARQLGTLARHLGSGAQRAEGFLFDHHHSRKLDAPSGTALRLASAFEEGAGSEIQVASVRAGHEVGHHVLGLDAPGELIEIHHRARSRRTFAEGLLAAAAFLTDRRGPGRRGVFGMRHVAAGLFPELFPGTAD